MDDHSDKASYIQLTANIVTAYVSNNTVPIAEIPVLISQVYSALMRVSSGAAGAAPAGPLKPTVPIKRSITPGYLVCLEDGKKFKSLKRHLRTQYQMTPDQYRAKWNLPANYPMVAPKYAAVRSQLAKRMGLGQQRRRRRDSHYSTNSGSTGGPSTGSTSSQLCQMRFRVAPRFDELAQIRFTRLKCNIGQLAPKQLVSQPNAIGVDDISFTIVGDLPDLAIDTHGVSPTWSATTVPSCSSRSSAVRMSSCGTSSSFSASGISSSVGKPQCPSSMASVRA
jgi:predicted transcriptional regulator